MYRKLILGMILGFVLLSPCLALSALPVVNFSDMTDGQVSGWSGSSTKGAAVSIWGNNFGSSRGSSYVSVAGVDLTAATDYAEWGATTNPTTARELQRITFWLNSGMSLGATTISVTNGDGTSVTIPFHTRNTGNIYFVSPSGNDSNTGLNDTDQMWATFYKVRTTINAGDVVYFRNGLWTQEEAGSGRLDAVLKLYDTIGGMPRYGFNDGTENNSITLTSYPAEVAQIGRGLETDAQYFIYRLDDAGKDGLNYWTFSKFKINTYEKNFAWAASTDRNKDTGLRIVGNDQTSVNSAKTHGHLINIFTNATNMSIFGNYLHGAGKVKDSDPHVNKTKGIYFAGGGVSDGVDVGWNEFYRNNGHPQFFGHFRTDSLDNLKFHDNFIHSQGQQVLVLGGGDPFAEPRYQFLYSAKVYNNVFANNDGLFRFSVGGNGLGGDFEIYNNTFYNNAQSFGVTVLIRSQSQDFFDFHNNITVKGPDSVANAYWSNKTPGIDNIPSSNNEIGTKNFWHGLGHGPAWATQSFNDIEPQFVVDNPVKYSDFRLKDSSAVAKKEIGVQFNVNNVNFSNADSSVLFVATPQGFQMIPN